MASVEEHTAVWVHFDDIDPELRPASQMRQGLNEDAIATYAENLDAIEFEEPVELFWDAVNKIHWVADGCHTIHAARKLKRHQIHAIVTNGTYQDAYHRGSRANDKHGVRVTNEDKRHRVREALKDPSIQGLSEHFIADICNVSFQLVNSIRSKSGDLEDQLNGDPPRVIGKDGKSYPARKTKGKTKGESKDKSKDKPKPKPQPIPEPPKTEPTTPSTDTPPLSGPEPNAEPDVTPSNDDVPSVQETVPESSADLRVTERAIFDRLRSEVIACLRRAFEECPLYFRSGLAGDARDEADRLLLTCDDVQDLTDSLFRNGDD
jgi:hypothetical protein